MDRASLRLAGCHGRGPRFDTGRVDGFISHAGPATDCEPCNLDIGLTLDCWADWTGLDWTEISRDLGALDHTDLSAVLIRMRRNRAQLRLRARATDRLR